jgi:hypothetical protein
MFETTLSMLTDQMRGAYVSGGLPRQEIGVKQLLIENLKLWTTTEEEARVLMMWIKLGYVPDETGSSLVDLTPKLKRHLVEAIFPISGIDRSEKYQLLEAALGKDASEEAFNVRLRCKAALPCAVSKAEVWTEMTKNEDGLSMMQLGELILSFQQSGQESLTAPYTETELFTAAPKFAD